MKVIQARPCGYCKGVIRAIQIARRTREENPDVPIHVLGMLVHNRFVTLSLEELGIISHNEKGKTRLELLDEIDEGIVIFSAHGVCDEVYEKARNKGLTIVDATCEDVIKTSDIVKKYLEEDYEVIYIGVRNHPEAEGIVSNSDHIHLISSEEDIKNLEPYEKVFITNQTTMNVDNIADIIEKLRIRYPEAIVQPEICNATRMRQQAVKNMKNLDILYVVGDPSSNNTRNLGKCVDESVKKVCYIETYKDIDITDLKDDYTVGVTAGASTPTELYRQVIDYLTDWHS